MPRSTAGQLARRISLRQLQVFESVARQCSYTRAAEELFLSQPTISMQIKKLETAIGLPLTELVGRKIALTEDGALLLATAREMLASLDRFEMQISDRKGLHSGRLRIAVVSTANYFAPRLLGQFCRDYPNISVQLEVTNREHILERMSENLDDLYLIGKPPRSGKLEFQPYLPNPLVMIAPAGHELGGRKRIPVAELAGQAFIIREQGSGTRIATQKFFAEAGQEMDVRMELGNNESIKQGVSAGLGLAVLSLHTLTSGDLDELEILDVEGLPISWRWYIGHPHGKNLSIVARTFIDYMVEHGMELLPAETRQRIEQLVKK